MNLVISTTCGWNIGDQFIYMGVRELLRPAWGPFSTVIHDRNPAKLLSGGEESHKAIACGWADALVIAGSPGWTTECAAIYRTAMEFRVPIYLIGIGAGAPPEALAVEVANSMDMIYALSEAALVICRDQICRDLALRYRNDVVLLPCPASAVTWAGHQNGAGSSGHLTALGPSYEGDWEADGVVAHQMADLERSGGRAFYSEQAVDYLGYYVRASHVTSARLHASVVCRSMGVPVENLWPDDDYRCVGAWSVLEEAMSDGLPQSLGRYRDLLMANKPQRRGGVA